jgi:hypothetical protein
MPVLNLGRVRPVFRGAFSEMQGDQVSKYDVVTHSGSAWFYISDTPSTVDTDPVNGNHPGTANDLGYWKHLAKGIEVVGSWSDGTTYFEGQVVSFGSSSFVARQKVPANNNLDPAAHPSYWMEFATGFGRYGGPYVSTNGYGTGDIVVHDGSCYIASKAIPPDSGGSSRPDRTLDWDMVAQGFHYVGDWEEAITTVNHFGIGSVVKHRASAYVCSNRLGASKTDNPATAPAVWTLLTKGLALGKHSDTALQGIWQATQNYYEGELVSYKNGIYIANRVVTAGERPGENPDPTLEGWTTVLAVDERYIQQKSVTATRIRYRFIGYTGDGV